MVKHLPPLAPLNYPQAKCVGDVFIHPHAVIAAGVLLWAEPGSRLEIGAGACIGMGTILHASHGTMLIATGASLGAGVLFIGSGDVGSQACIGAATTMINTSVAAGAVIPPGSLLGDTSRQVPILENLGIRAEHPQAAVIDSNTSPGGSSEPSNQFESNSAVPNQASEPQTPTVVPPPQPKDIEPQEVEIETVGLVSETTEHITQTSTKTVYGQGYVNQMLKQMFNRSTS